MAKKKTRDIQSILPKFIIFGERKYECLGYKRDKTSKGFTTDKKAVVLVLVEILSDGLMLEGTHPKIGSQIMTTWPISEFINHEKIF